MQIDLDQLREAVLVRDEHREGTCDECHGIGPCRRYSTWFPIIAELPQRQDPWLGDEKAWWP
jgi:hypothetical protein